SARRRRARQGRRARPAGRARQARRPRQASCARRVRRRTSPRFLATLGPDQHARLVRHAVALILVQELAAQQTARVLRDTAQPLVGRLIGRPLLEIVGGGELLRLVPLGLVLAALAFVFLRVLLVVAGELLVAAIAVVRLLSVLRRSARIGRLLALLAALVIRLRLIRRLLGRARALRVALEIVLALLLVLLAVLLRLLLLLLRVVLEELLEQVAVVPRVGMLGIELERPVVGRDGLLELAGLRKRIAAVVVGRNRVETGQARGALLELARAVERRRAPLVVLEQPRGFGRALGLERLVAALIGAQPEALPFERLRPRRRCDADDRDEPNGDPAAPEAEREERQQQEHEPRSAIEP